MLRLKLGRLSATTTPLRSKISPRVGGIGCTWTRLFSDRVEWYSYWITCRKYRRAISTPISSHHRNCPEHDAATHQTGVFFVVLDADRLGHEGSNYLW